MNLATRAQAGALPRRSTAACATASPRSRPGATRSRRSGSPRPRASSRPTACASPGSAAAACSRPTARDGRQRDDRRQPARHRRGGGARRRLPRAGGRRPARARRDLAGGARRWSPTASPRCCRMPAPSGVPLAIEPLHPMYAADRACVNTIDQALDICDAAGRGRRRRHRRLSRLVGPRPRRGDRAGRADGPHPRPPHLRLAGADHATCCSIAA